MNICNLARRPANGLCQTLQGTWRNLAKVWHVAGGRVFLLHGASCRYNASTGQEEIEELHADPVTIQMLKDVTIVSTVVLSVSKMSMKPKWVWGQVLYNSARKGMEFP